MTKMTINGKSYTVTLPPETPMLWALRDELGLTGTKFGCGLGLCGACTIHIDGVAVRSCITPLSTAAGKQVSTIEHAEHDKLGAALQAAWVDAGVPQCGYCQGGQIMSALALLKSKPKPNDVDIDEAMSGNLCRSGTYTRIRAVIKTVAGVAAGDKA